MADIPAWARQTAPVAPPPKWAVPKWATQPTAPLHDMNLGKPPQAAPTAAEAPSRGMADVFGDPATAVSQLSRAPADTAKSYLGATGEAFNTARGVAQEGVADMKSGEGLRVLAGALKAVRGTVGEIAAPVTGAVLGPGQWADPGQLPEAAHVPEAAYVPKASPASKLSALAKDKAPAWAVERNPEGRPIVPHGGLQDDEMAKLTAAFKEVGIDTESPDLKAAEKIDPRAAIAGQAAVGKVADRIASPAIKTGTGLVRGPNHDAIKAGGAKGDEGFVTEGGQFLTRDQAAERAAETGQNATGKDANLRTHDLKDTPAAKSGADDFPEWAKALSTPEAKKVKEPDAHLLSAAATPAGALPAMSLRDLANGQDDRFFKLRQQHTADKAELTQRLDAMPDAVKTPEMQRKFYRHMEGDPGVTLTPEEKAIYDKHIVPLKREERDLYEEVKKTDLDVKDYDPEYAHRIVRGKNRAFDNLLGNQGADANPVGGFKSRKTSSMNSRRFFTIEDSRGTRKVISVDDNGGLHVVEHGKYTSIQHDALRVGEEAPRGVGDKFRVGGKEYTIKQARTNELEDHTGVKYYQNALANTMDNVLRLRAVSRVIYETERLKNSPDFAQHSVLASSKHIPKGWKQPEMPLFRDRFMEPLMADVIDDFYGKSRGDLLETLAKINRFAVSSLFWSPVPHALNAGAHWVTARGWDWITPKGIKSFALDGARAIREVVTQGKDYQRLLREGSGLVYGGVANREFYETMLKRVGESIKREPNKWDPIARALGVGPSDLVRMLYEGSSRALWSVSDMFMLQRVFELERKGMSTADAIKNAERHIPNYRIPPEVLRSRMVSQFLKDPALTEFSRYHYGMLKSYAHMAVDLVGPKATPKQRFEALGNIMATAALMTLVWPAINHGIQQLSGDEDLEMGPKGSTTISQNLIDMYGGKKDVIQVLSSLVTLAPVLRGTLEMFPSNMDWFTKKPIAEPADMKHRRVGRVAAQEAEHAAKTFVQPYGMLDQAITGKDSLGKTVAKQALGLRNKPKPWTGGRGKSNQDEDAAKRHMRPRGLIEKGEAEAEDALRRYGGTQ